MTLADWCRLMAYHSHHWSPPEPQVFKTLFHGRHRWEKEKTQATCRTAIGTEQLVTCHAKTYKTYGKDAVYQNMFLNRDHVSRTTCQWLTLKRIYVQFLCIKVTRNVGFWSLHGHRKKKQNHIHRYELSFSPHSNLASLIYLRHPLSTHKKNEALKHVFCRFNFHIVLPFFFAFESINCHFWSVSGIVQWHDPLTYFSAFLGVFLGPKEVRRPVFFGPTASGFTRARCDLL